MLRKQLFFLCFLLPLIGFAQTDSTDIIVQKMMKKQQITGLSLAVVKNGETVINKGYGRANVELNVPATTETVYRIASLSKQFFATAVMKLVEENKIKLNDSVHKFFPDAPETWRPITIRHLLSHSSGLKREAPAYNPYIIQSDLKVIQSAYPLPLDFKPGEKYQYCNLGYFMIADIIAQVTGLPWQDYINQSFFLPKGMKNTGITNYYTIIPNRASGYMHRKDTLLNAENALAIRASGAFLSTTTDMIKWDKVLNEQNKFLSKNNWQQLWQPVIATSTEPDNQAFYGLGWMLDTFNGHQMIWHGGSQPGFRAAYTRFVNDGLTIIIFTNTDEAKPQDIVKELAAYYFRK